MGKEKARFDNGSRFSMLENDQGEDVEVVEEVDHKVTKVKEGTYPMQGTDKGHSRNSIPKFRQVDGKLDGYQKFKL